MDSLQQPLYADEFCPNTVAGLALRSLRQPGGIAHVGGLSISSYRPCDRSRIWLVEDGEGNLLAEEPSLYRAIHAVAR